VSGPPEDTGLPEDAHGGIIAAASVLTDVSTHWQLQRLICSLALSSVRHNGASTEKGKEPMLIPGAILSILGLICDVIAGVVLLPKIFITDEELSLLAGLPIEPSTTHLTGKVTRANLPVAVTDVERLNEYRDSYIEARKEERNKGRIGLWLLVVGSCLQAFGVILALL
jgi:hypothetical protein